jgi:hypothetical protein
LSWAAVCARRLDRQWLAAPARNVAAAQVVGAMCGAHAQVMSAAELSVGIRMADVTRAHVRDALWHEHSLVKTRGPRGTVHLLPAAELPAWTGALAAVPSRPNDLLSAEQTDAVVAAIDRVLADGGAMTAEEMDAGVIAATGPWAGDRFGVFGSGSWPRWRWAMGAATYRGVLCFGPNRGNKVTHTSPRAWLPGFAPADGPTALRWLVGRYLLAYGPATPESFAQWLAAPRRWATELFAAAAAQREIEEVELEGGPAWIVAGDTSAPTEPPRGVRLLPYFDAYGIAGHPRELLFPGRAGERALARAPRLGNPTGGQAGNFPVLLVDGVVAGVWHATRSGRRMEITVEPLVGLSAAQQAELTEQADRVGAVAEARATLTIGAVGAGPHA